jgi:hypothetical protein
VTSLLSRLLRKVFWTPVAAKCERMIHCELGVQFTLLERAWIHWETRRGRNRLGLPPRRRWA